MGDAIENCAAVRDVVQRTRRVPNPARAKGRGSGSRMAEELARIAARVDANLAKWVLRRKIGRSGRTLP